jgi:DNA-binding transcriptional ArsR family regulator
MLLPDGPQLIDPRLLKALAHPTRVHILDILSEGPSSPSRIARRMGPHTGVRSVAHHIKVLERLGCVILVDEIRSGPAVEHIYRATERQFFNAEEWEAIEPKNRQPITATILRLIAEDTAKALSTGRFDERPDNHLSRSPLEVDNEGWAELVAILARTLDEVLAVHDKSVERVAKSGEALMAARVVMMQFLIDRENPYDGEATP